MVEYSTGNRGENEVLVLSFQQLQTSRRSTEVPSSTVRSPFLHLQVKKQKSQVSLRRTFGSGWGFLVAKHVDIIPHQKPSLAKTKSIMEGVRLDVALAVVKLQNTGRLFSSSSTEDVNFPEQIVVVFLPLKVSSSWLQLSSPSSTPKRGEERQRVESLDDWRRSSARLR